MDKSHKKLLLISVLSKIKDKWPLGKDLLTVIKTFSIDDQAIDSIMQKISSSLKDIENKDQQKKLEKSIQALKRIKMIENSENNTLEKELGDILEQL